MVTHAEEQQKNLRDLAYREMKNKGRAHEAERQRKGNNEKVSEGNAHFTISQILRSFLCPGPFCKVKEPIRALLSGYKIFLWEEFFTDHITGGKKVVSSGPATACTEYGDMQRSCGETL